MEKILITGTGRCGTTFLIQLFSFLDYDTGYNKLNYQNYISKNCNAGMERQIYENYTFLKNPIFFEHIAEIAKYDHVKVKCVILPVRKFEDSARSRASIGNGNGGLWNASNEAEQIRFYDKMMSNYIITMLKHDIHTIFLDFDRMVSDPVYLFKKLSPVLEPRTTLELFCDVYHETTLNLKKNSN